MKKILALVLVFALAFVGVLPAFALEAGKYKENSNDTKSLTAVKFVTEFESGTPNAKVVGRTNPLNPLLIGNHAAGVEFNVTGTEVVGVRLQSYNPSSHTPISLYFEIDGKQVVVEGAETTTQGTYDYVLKTNLSTNTTHKVKVTLDQENWAQYNYHGFYITHALVDNANATVSKAADGDYKILVYGDSITSANNIGGVHLSYHQLMAKKFNADTQVFSVSGGVFGENYYKDSTGAVEDWWKFQLARDWNTSAWYLGWEESATKASNTMKGMSDANNDGVRDAYETDPNNVKFAPDLVLINIGTNDSTRIAGNTNSYQAQNQQIFKDGFYAMLDEMFGFNGGAGYYRDTTVILSYGLMGISSGVKTFYNQIVAEYLTQHPELVGSGPNGEDRLTTYYYTPCATTGGTIGKRWDAASNSNVNDAHPNTASHAYAAEELTAYLADYMGWEVKPTDVAYPNNDGVLDELPEVERKEKKLFLGFTDKNDSYVKKGGQIAWGSYIYSNYLDVNLDGFVDADGNVNDPNPVKATDKYTNGFFVQGAQIRVGLNPEDKATGLRFIVVNNTEIKEALQTAVAENLNFERGIMVISGSKYVGGEIGLNTANASKVPANNIFASTATLNANYDKFTACVINIPESYFSTNVIVRPYFKYTDNSGVEHVYYGEQYSCSLFAAARAAYGKESDEVNEYLYNTIISKCKGDNDTQIQF